MAKFERQLQGDFDAWLQRLDDGILKGSLSASREDSSDFTINGVRCAVRVYERYSMIGNNRVSLNITLAGFGNDLWLSAITAGGSQAMLFKLNTFGEEAFLDCIRDIVE